MAAPAIGDHYCRTHQLWNYIVAYKMYRIGLGVRGVTVRVRCSVASRCAWIVLGLVLGEGEGWVRVKVLHRLYKPA